MERLAVEPNLLIWFKKYRSSSSSRSLPVNMTTLEEYDNFYDDRMMIENLWRWKYFYEDVVEIMNFFLFQADRLIISKSSGRTGFLPTRYQTKQKHNSGTRWPHKKYRHDNPHNMMMTTEEIWWSSLELFYALFRAAHSSFLMVFEV